MASSPPDGALSYPGAQDHGVSRSDYATTEFIVRRILSRTATTSLVQVKAVHPGEGGAVGFVDVQPMVNQINGANDAVPHGTIFNVPYLRMQGGACAIVIDPAVGDIGIATFAAEDISSVKANRAVSNPGTRRRFNMADALYHGGVLNGVPTTFIQIIDGQVTITAATGVTINAPQVETSGDVIINGIGFLGHTHLSHGDDEQTDPPNP